MRGAASWGSAPIRSVQIKPALVLPQRTLRGDGRTAHTADELALTNYTGRYDRHKVGWCDRRCDLCDTGQVQDEMHVLMECASTEHLRIRHMQVVLDSNWDVSKLMQLDSTEQVAEFVADCVREVDRWYDTDNIGDGEQP